MSDYKTNADALTDCYIQASVASHDPSTQNAAMIGRCDDQQRLVSYANGVNRVPGVAAISPKEFARFRDDRDCKLKRIEHAERNAIYTAARYGIKTFGLTMWCPWAACIECGRAIVAAGIVRLVVHQQRMDITDPRWRESVEFALAAMRDAGVEICYFDGPVKAPPILVGGRLWSPGMLQ